MKKYVFITLLLLIIVGCSPQKRLQRLVSKHPELVQTDTIKLTDTTYIPGTKIDTTFVHGKNDTIVFWKDNIKVQIINHFDTTQVVITKPPDTIIKKINVPVQKIVIVNKDHSFWLIAALVSWCLLLLVLWIYKK